MLIIKLARIGSMLVVTYCPSPIYFRKENHLNVWGFWVFGGNKMPLRKKWHAAKKHMECCCRTQPARARLATQPSGRPAFRLQIQCVSLRNRLYPPQNHHFRHKKPESMHPCVQLVTALETNPSPNALRTDSGQHRASTLHQQ